MRNMPYADKTGVSIIIPTYNGKKLLAENLPFVAEECARYEGETEILVVDDGGGDGTAEFLAAEFPGVKLIRSEKNEGFSKTVNKGVLRAVQPLVFLLNNDIKLTPGVLAGLSGCFNEKDVFAVQAKIVSDAASENEDFLGVFSSKYGLFKYSYVPAVVPPGKPAEMDFASGGASMFNREKFLALGLFDERFSPFYFEDLDLSFRARWFGWRILYQPAAKVHHLHLGSTVKANYSALKYGIIHKKNYFLFLLKNTVSVGGLPVFLCYVLYRSFKGGFMELAGFFKAVREFLFLSPEPSAALRANILYLDSPLPWPGGGQISLLNILKSLAEYRPFVVLSGRSDLVNDLRREGIPWRMIKAGKADLPGFLPLALRIFNLVRPSLVHCNSGTTFFTFIFAVAAKLRGIPFVWHNRVLETAGLKERVIAALSSRVIVISEAVGGKFKRLAPEKVIKLENAVDLEIFKPGAEEQLYAEFGLDRRTKVIGIFSRLEKWKGHELFLAASRLALSELPGCAVLVAGEGPERGRLEQLVHELEMDGKVLFTGHRKDIPALMNLCAIIVNPSILPEPFGRTIIEGMACGKPVIATAMGGPLELIEDGVDGFLAAPEAGTIAGLIRKLLENPEYAAGIGAKARKKAESRFDLRGQAARLLEIYKDCENARA